MMEKYVTPVMEAEEMSSESVILTSTIPGTNFNDNGDGTISAPIGPDVPPADPGTDAW